MLNLNEIVLAGRTVADVEAKAVNDKHVANLRLAVARDGVKDTTDFFDIVAWNKLAETIATYVGKGSEIYVKGRLQTRTYETKDGSKKTVTEIVADSVKFVSLKKPVTAEQPQTTSVEPEVVSVTDETVPF